LIVSGANFFDRIDLVDYWPNESTGNEWEDPGREPMDCVCFFFDGTRTQNGADDRSAFAHEETEIDLGFGAGGRADGDETAALSERLQVEGKYFPATKSRMTSTPRLFVHFCTVPTNFSGVSPTETLSFKPSSRTRSSLSAVREVP
jgi:hypothetical protein